MNQPFLGSKMGKNQGVILQILSKLGYWRCCLNLQSGNRKEVRLLADTLVGFLVSVGAGVVANVICKLRGPYLCTKS